MFELDGELHSADSHHQRFLHGVLLPGHQAASLPLHQKPLQHRLLQAIREVQLQSVLFNISLICDSNTSF